METKHTVVCGCCGTGKLTVTIDDAGPHWGDCPNCGKSPLSMEPATHAELMAAHTAQQDPNAVGSLCALDPLCYEKPIPCPHHVERPAGQGQPERRSIADEEAEGVATCLGDDAATLRGLGIQGGEEIAANMERAAELLESTYGALECDARPGDRLATFAFNPALHADTADLVARFAAALAAKLYAAQEKYGYSDGWRRDDWMDECQERLVEHVAKGDPRDVAAYCAFLWHHGAPTALVGLD